MMIFAMIVSSIVVATTALIARKSTPTAYGWAALTAFVASLLSLGCLGHPLVAADLLLIAIVAAIFACRVPRCRWFLITSVLVTALLYGFISLCDLPYLLEGRRLRAQYPLESLADRLSYEEPRRADSGRSPAAEAYAMHEAKKVGFAWTDLAALEGELGGHGGYCEAAWQGYERSLTLAEVHSSFVKQFVDSPGFGFGRRIQPDRRVIALPEERPIHLPPPPYQDPSKPDASGQLRAIPSNPPKRPGEDGFEQSVESFHRASYLDFINPLGFGYVVDRDHVAGFQSHQFQEMPSFPGPDTKQKWELEALDLLSLLKHPEPMAYVSDDLPRMEELRHAPVRPLDVFESKALAGLRTGEDLEVASKPDRIRMLGSIRAAKQCVRCHDVDRGELLGAFSYRLRLAK